MGLITRLMLWTTTSMSSLNGPRLRLWTLLKTMDTPKAVLDTQGSEKVHQWRILSNFKARVENGEDFTLDDLQKALDDIKSPPPPPKAIE